SDARKAHTRASAEVSEQSPTQADRTSDGPDSKPDGSRTASRATSVPHYPGTPGGSHHAGCHERTTTPGSDGGFLAESFQCVRAQGSRQMDAAGLRTGGDPAIRPRTLQGPPAQHGAASCHAVLSR